MTSNLRTSVLYIVRWPAAKTANGEMAASKYGSLFHNVAREKRLWMQIANDDQRRVVS